MREDRGVSQSGQPVHVVVMGVSGTGKSSVAQRLAAGLELPLHEGDAHHPAGNIAKMAAGLPLIDEDRRPWLETLAGLLAQDHDAGRSSVLTCSALRRGYRDLLRSRVPAGSVFFVHLSGDLDTLSRRMDTREGHFMPSTLLRSQLATLEPLGPGERGVVLDVAAPLDEVVAQAQQAMRGAGLS